MSTCHQEILTLNHPLAGRLRMRPDVFIIDSMRGYAVLAMVPADGAFEAGLPEVPCESVKGRQGGVILPGRRIGRKPAPGPDRRGYDQARLARDASLA